MANYPESPNGESEGGWLGSIFNLSQSDSDQLVVKSGKVGLGVVPTEKLDVAGRINLNGNLITNVSTPVNAKDAANKEYVDAAGGSVVINGSTMPTMISALSGVPLSWGTAAAYCANLAEGGYTDWRMPNRDELVYMVAGGGGSAITDNFYLWTSTMGDAFVTGSPSSHYWVVLNPANGYWDVDNYHGNPNYVRCVR